MNSLNHPIDENGLLRLELSAANGHVKARLHSLYDAESSALVKNILPLISLGGNAPKSAAFDIPTPPEGTLELRINKQLFARFAIRGSEITLTDAPRKLSVFETRIIGRAPQADAPYPVSSEAWAGMLTPVTDLHTHLSTQSRTDDLIDMGLDPAHIVYYPVAALRMLGIHDYKTEGLKKIPKRKFLPLAHLQSATDAEEDAVPLSNLSPQGLEKLKKAMRFTPEDQSTYEAMENCYYFREPFTKDIRLLPEILRTIAKHYKEQGIEYAELSTTALSDPKWSKEAHCPTAIEWLKAVHEVMPEIEKTGVHFRFRPDLPRNLGEEALSERIALYKRIAPSPYIAGPDIIGYEMNKTSHLNKHLNELLAWMHEKQPGESMQIHAGENAKNPANVREALELGLANNVRIMMGHAIYGIDEETMSLATQAAKRGLIVGEFLFDSNIACNNIDYPADVPIGRFLAAKVPCILSSDGADIYRTSARQTAMAGLFCGVTPEGFKAIRDTEKSYIGQQLALLESKRAALLEPEFFALPAIRPPARETAKADSPPPASRELHEDLQAIIASRRPIFFAGAGGSGWKGVPEAEKEKFVEGLTALLMRLDPEKVYFVKGRIKKTGGVNIELEKAIARYNQTHVKQFACLDMLAETETAPPDSPSEQHYTMKLRVPLMNLPSTVVGFLKEHNGFAFYIGGEKFTRDFILESYHRDVPFGLMSTIPHASQSKAGIYPDHAFESVKGMIACADSAGLMDKRLRTDRLADSANGAVPGRA